jgi:hypothetical protein
MTPERMAELVVRWARLYTRGLPAPVARRRIDEIDADLHDQIAHERAHGRGERRIALSLFSRMARGVAADVAWRGRHAKATTARRAVTRPALATALVLLLPLLAMQIAAEVAWNVADFVVAGVLVFGTGLTYELVARKTGDVAYRFAVGVALAAAFILVWAIGAVGVIGAEGNPADRMYAGVLAVGIAGAVVARFRPAGMARALLATALAQAAVAAIALIGGEHRGPATSVLEILGVNAFFVALFVGSAWLFRRAARKQPAADAP